MNKIFLSGRLCADPEMRKTQSGIDVLNFRLAVDRPGTRGESKLTDYFDCTVWGSKDGPGRTGAVQKFFHKGDGININGPMVSRQYENKETGKTETRWGVKVDDWEFPLGKKQDTAQAAHAEQAETHLGGRFEEVKEEELPF